MQYAANRQQQDQLLHEAMTLARTGQFDHAQQVLDRVLHSNAKHADALQLSGLIARQCGDNEKAIALFSQSLAAHPAQPHVRNNMGNALVAVGRHEEAVDAYRSALSSQPDYHDAELNLAIALLRCDRAEEAAAILDELLAKRPDLAKAHALRGELFNLCNQYDSAVTAFQNALRLRPGHMPWQHNLAIALRLSGHAGRALPLFRECARAMPDTAEVHYNLGHCLQDSGEGAEAARAYRAALRVAPADAGIHASLHALVWTHGDPDAAFDAYRQAVQSHPDNIELRTAMANRLVMAGRAEQALAVLQPALDHPDRTADLLLHYGKAMWSSARPAEALDAFYQALDTEPGHPATQRELARSLIVLDRPYDARPVIAQRLTQEPWDQQALALQVLTDRLTGVADGRLSALSLIRSFRLDPDGFTCAEFNDQLDRELDQFHHGHTHPVDQTLRGGTQTADDLFRHMTPCLRTLRLMIEEAVTRYIADLPDDRMHPFLARKRNGFDFSGSWSVRLQSGGYHTNHIHPEGWISAVYYVALPATSEEKQQGWLTFGETGLNLGERETILTRIKPEAGMLVLFPSYFYHGTVPFDGDAHRTTIAFDIVPKG